MTLMYGLGEHKEVGVVIDNGEGMTVEGEEERTCVFFFQAEDGIRDRDG